MSIRGTRIRTLGRGGYFGEIALIDEGTRPATVTACTEVICHGLAYWEFRPLVQANATIAWNLLQALAKRPRSAPDVQGCQDVSIAGRVAGAFEAGIRCCRAGV